MEESGGFIVFMGEYIHNIDEKNRIVIPTKFREYLEEQFVIAKGLEKCLYIYAMRDWQNLVDKLNTLPFTKKNSRTFMRSFFAGATVCELDRQGRTQITSPLVKYAGLEKEVVIIGANDHMEIWDKNAWDCFLLDVEEEKSDIAESLFMDVNL